MSEGRELVPNYVVFAVKQWVDENEEHVKNWRDGQHGLLRHDMLENDTSAEDADAFCDDWDLTRYWLYSEKNATCGHRQWEKGRDWCVEVECTNYYNLKFAAANAKAKESLKRLGIKVD